MTLNLREKGERWWYSARSWCTDDTKVVSFIYYWCIEFCKHELGINKNTVVDWNNYMREVCAAEILTNPVVIGGPNTTLEEKLTKVFSYHNSRWKSFPGNT